MQSPVKAASALEFESPGGPSVELGHMETSRHPSGRNWQAAGQRGQIRPLAGNGGKRASEMATVASDQG